MGTPAAAAAAATSVSSCLVLLMARMAFVMSLSAVVFTVLLLPLISIQVPASRPPLTFSAPVKKPGGKKDFAILHQTKERTRPVNAKKKRDIPPPQNLEDISEEYQVEKVPLL